MAETCRRGCDSPGCAEEIRRSCRVAEEEARLLWLKRGKSFVAFYMAIMIFTFYVTLGSHSFCCEELWVVLVVSLICLSVWWSCVRSAGLLCSIDGLDGRLRRGVCNLAFCGMTCFHTNISRHLRQQTRLVQSINL